jgi:glutamate--cysteine ligase
VARRGRDPSLQLVRADGREILLSRWLEELFESFHGPATLLDDAHRASRYRENLDALRPRIEAPEQTPSARMLKEMQEREEEFVQFALRISKERQEYFLSRDLPTETRRRFMKAARDSLAEQKRLEGSDPLPFEAYLEAYFRDG